MFRNRSVVEIMVFVFTCLVALVMLIAIITIAVVEINNPRADTQPIVQTLTNLTSAILGALLGLIAGRSAKSEQFSTRPDNTPNGIGREPNGQPDA